MGNSFAGMSIMFDTQRASQRRLVSMEALAVASILRSEGPTLSAYVQDVASTNPLRLKDSNVKRIRRRPALNPTAPPKVTAQKVASVLKNVLRQMFEG